MSSYKREEGWPKCTADPWTHCMYIHTGSSKKKLLSCEKVKPGCAWLVLSKTGPFFRTSLYVVTSLPLHEIEVQSMAVQVEQPNVGQEIWARPTIAYVLRVSHDHN